MEEARIHDRASRARLAKRHHPYWRLLSEGRHLGYYAGPSGGKWVARYRDPQSSQGYRSKAIGNSDDLVPADGTHVLSWKQAMDEALGWFAELDRGMTAGAGLTVEAAIRCYVEQRDQRLTAQRGRPSRSDAHRLLKYAGRDPELMSLPLMELSEQRLKAWHESIGNLSGAGKQRLLNDMKAALNHCFSLNRKSLPPDLPLIARFGLRLDGSDWGEGKDIARINQILTDEQVRTIIGSVRNADPDLDFYRMVLLLAATGARFSQLQRMTVADVEPAPGRLIIPTSRKGKRTAASLIKMRVGPDVIDALLPCIRDRSPSEPLLTRWRHRQVSRTKWVRIGRGPWQSSSEMTRPWNRAIAGLGLDGIVPYALRHSSIVRGIRTGLPIRLVAALHDTSVVMIERHYSRWITEGLEEFAAQAIIPLAAE